MLSPEQILQHHASQKDRILKACEAQTLLTESAQDHLKKGGAASDLLSTRINIEGADFIVYVKKEEPTVEAE